MGAMPVLHGHEAGLSRGAGSTPTSIASFHVPPWQARALQLQGCTEQTQPPRQAPTAHHPAASPHTYIVALQVRVVLLNAIIQDGNHDALARVALLPGLTHIQVPLVCVVLPREVLAIGTVPSHWYCSWGVPGPLPGPAVRADKRQPSPLSAVAWDEETPEDPGTAS